MTSRPESLFEKGIGFTALSTSEASSKADTCYMPSDEIKGRLSQAGWGFRVG